MVRSRRPASLFGEWSLQTKGKTTFLIFPRDLGLFASGWVASNGVLPHSIFCCSVWNGKSSSTETWYSWTKWKWKKKVLITWTASSLSIRTGLYFFTHEKPAPWLFSPVKPSRGAHYQDLKYIHQLSWFVHMKQNIFYFCQLWKGHSSLMPLCWFFWAFDFYELCFWAWWFQPHCGSGQQAGLPPGVFFFICLCNPLWAPWQVLAQQLPPMHHCALSGAVQAPPALWFQHMPYPSWFPFPSFLPPFLLYFFLPQPLCSSSLSAPPLAAFSRLPCPSLTSAEGDAVPSAITLAWSPLEQASAHPCRTLFLLPAFPISGWTSIMLSTWPPAAMKCVICGRSQCKVLSV